MRHLIMPLLAAAALALSTAPAYADLGDQLAKLLPNDGAAWDEFARSVALSGNIALVGAPYHDDNGPASGSAYVFRYDGSGWLQEAKLLPDDGAPGDLFGWSVAVSGNAALIGALRDDDNGTDSGSAYVFRYDGSRWLQETKLLPDDGAAGDLFGNSVGVCGNTAVVAAVFDDDACPANPYCSSGSAYVFRYDGSTWLQEAKLLPDDGYANDQFGVSVALSVNTALVGAWYDDDNGFQSGSAYVFRYDGSTWVQEAKLVADDGVAWDQFGHSVAVSRNTAVVGTLNHMGVSPGTAYVFRYDGSAWLQEAKLLPDDGAPVGFGWSVAVSGSTIVVGAIWDDGNERDSGSAYVFRNDGSTWVQEAKLLADDGASDDYFGFPVAVSGNTAVVGAYGHDDNGDSSGSAYLFDASVCPWDLDAGGSVGILDLLALLAAWGTDPGGPPDFDGDGTVGILDLLTLLANWGPCP